MMFAESMPPRIQLAHFILIAIPNTRAQQGGMVSVIEDLGSISYNIWGKVKKSVTDAIAVSARADVNSDDINIIDVDLRVESGGNMVQLLATKGDGEVTYNSVQAKGSFGIGPGDVTINPRYNLKSEKADVSVAFELEKTAFGVSASTDFQKFTLSRTIGDNTMIAPTIATNGDFSFAVKQSIERGTVTGTFKANDSLSLEWADGPWVANVVAPIEGYTYNGIKVSAKKKLDF